MLRTLRRSLGFCQGLISDFAFVLVRTHDVDRDSVQPGLDVGRTTALNLRTSGLNCNIRSSVTLGEYEVEQDGGAGRRGVRKAYSYRSATVGSMRIARRAGM